ncbi:GLPGLI family protein [Chryseobacterium sp. CFS15]|uniref:GLPGLI family protein n=1 Tax=Chryseobacterium sp. CFS15 TaxID=2986946 RepID=UPI00280A2E40|nr:GLPGLI family protein [Chryseobacterium sp. CFS15]MDQ8140574.1 GLPGLI family protein [Chryseobacterium sp. CFS15]
MKIILFSLLITFEILSSQNHRFIYKLEINKKDDFIKTNMALDISDSSVKFYELGFVKNDSLRKTGKNTQYFLKCDQLLLRKRNSFENKIFFSHGYDYFAIRSTDKIDWKLEKETKKVQDYTLQKATSNFGGRKWIAWFSHKIPFQEGPYKFRGLSGLIFEIYDSENIFHYTLVKSITLPEAFDTSNFLETHYGKKPIAVSLKQYHKIKLDSYNNVIEEFSDFIRKGGTLASDDDLSTPEKIRERKKSIQKSIKEYYLPIEKDKAIPYPKD